jgi:hypothetical protein
MIRRITDLTPIATSEIADSDLIEIVDRNDDTMSETGTNKSVTTQDLANYLSKIISEDVTVAVNSNNNAVHITQGGGGNALLVSDESGDSSPFVITSVGDVGIGTQLPTTKLHVAGNTAINGNISILKSDGTVKASITSPEENSIAFGTASTEKIRIDVSGNVGIGTSDPVHRLDIVGQAIRLSGGSSLWNGIVIKNSEAGSEVDKGAFFDHQNENNIAITSYNSYSYGDGSADLIMSVTPAGDRSIDRRVAAITVKGNGNVAIGTSNTIAKLGVVANSGGSSLILTDNVNSTLTVKHESPLNLLTYQGYGTTTQRWTSLANDSATPVEHMRITPTGNVGIGVDPTARLTISANQNNNTPSVNGIHCRNYGQNADDNAVISVSSSGANGGDAIMSWDIAGVAGWCAGIDNSDNDKFKIANNWSDLTNGTHITVSRDGNVGIGIVNPYAKLEINSSTTNILPTLSSSVTDALPNALRIYGDGQLISTCGPNHPIRHFAIGGTVASPTAVADGFGTAGIYGFAYNGSTSGTTSAFNGYGFGGIGNVEIKAKGVQTPTNGGSYITFNTTVQNTVNTTVERMRIEHNGVITTPAMPAFLARGPQTITPGNVFRSYAVEVFDRGNNFDPTTGVFTAPATGIYYFTFHALIDKVTTGEFRISLLKNGGEYHRIILYKNWSITASQAYQTISIDGHIDLSTGDTVSVYYVSGPGSLYTPDTGGVWSKFSGHMIG